MTVFFVISSTDYNYVLIASNRCPEVKTVDEYKNKNNSLMVQQIIPKTLNWKL